MNSQTTLGQLQRLALFAFFIVSAASAMAASQDESDVVINEILFHHNAQTLWQNYATDSVSQWRDSLTYPELYQEELDSWLENELSWPNVEPLFREKLKSKYSIDQLSVIAESLRHTPSGYPKDRDQKGFGPELFRIGVEVAQQIYPALIARLKAMRELYEPKTPPSKPALPRPSPRAIGKVRLTDHSKSRPNASGFPTPDTQPQ